MRTEAILRREAGEREAFSRVATVGRSAHSDSELIIPHDTVTRFLRLFDAKGALTPTRPLEQMILWAEPRAGKRVLEICCHDGEYGAILALLGAEVDSIDIAEPLVALARRRAELNGVADRQRAHVMSVHEMNFADGTFDVVFGKASLHHLDLDAARAEIFRVLKPGGVAVFSEPVVLSPMLHRLRKLVPVPPDAESPDERQLAARDVEEFVAPFTAPRFAYYRVLSRLDRVVPSLREQLCTVDRWLLAHVPGAERTAAVCVFAVEKPVRVAS